MSEQPLDLSTLSARELLGLYSSILTELIRRGVVRSRNAPAGDYAELLVAQHYGGELASGSAKSYDVLLVEGRKVQVKARVVQRDEKRTQFFSAFRTFDFDACVFVAFDSTTYRVERAIELDSRAVSAMAREVTWVAAHRVSVRQVMAAADAHDLTEQLRATQDEVERLGL